ncbi:MAG: carboxypeptidase regulatory-like domain-containing protein, partial [Bacteroidia bacterium]|nr:carboxypeptidase regulatory-like domain-containing protein [Bacteroidia bacterium]
MKTTLSVFISIALMLTGLNACKKDATTTVSGRVTDATTGVAVPNATVYIQRRNTSCFSCNAGTFASVKADSKGNFVYSFEADKDFSYSIAAEANNYFSNKPSGGIGIDSYKKNSLLVPLQPIAWLKLHVKNTAPFD